MEGGRSSGLPDAPPRPHARIKSGGLYAGSERQPHYLNRQVARQTHVMATEGH